MDEKEEQKKLARLLTDFKRMRRSSLNGFNAMSAAAAGEQSPERKAALEETAEQFAAYGRTAEKALATLTKLYERKGGK
jgi:hypothetical protein